MWMGKNVFTWSMKSHIRDWLQNLYVSGAFHWNQQAQFVKTCGLNVLYNNQRPVDSSLLWWNALPSFSRIKWTNIRPAHKHKIIRHAYSRTVILLLTESSNTSLQTIRLRRLFAHDVTVNVIYWSTLMPHPPAAVHMLYHANCTVKYSIQWQNQTSCAPCRTEQE